MDKDNYIEAINSSDLTKKSKNLLKKQINNFYYVLENYRPRKHKYKIGDYVKLKKGTLLHGTWRNIDSLENIAKEGLITGQFKGRRNGKYLYTVGVWYLKKDTLLKDYINFYSGGCITYVFWPIGDRQRSEHKKVIPFDEMHDFLLWLKKIGANTWTMEQTKESRFMPSLAQDCLQIGIIINGTNKYAKLLKQGDILTENISLKDAKEFVHPYVYDSFFVPNRGNKDIYFTDRESAILFGVPAKLIEGILVGRKYEKDKKILKHIKELLPNVYICNLDGKIIVE